MKYIAPKAKLISFTVTSVILTSGDNDLPDDDEIVITQEATPADLDWQ